MQCDRRNLSGFTLLEMPFAMAVIALLAALLLPAVQASREAARRQQCGAHLHQLGLAMHAYHDAHRKFPPGWVHQIEQRSNYGWGTSILPMIEQLPLFDQIDMGRPGLAQALRDPQKQPALQSVLPAYRCPSDSGPPLNDGRLVMDDQDKLHKLAISNYAGVNGGGEWTRGRELRGCFGENSRVGIQDVLDGTVHTVLIGERAWQSGGQRCNAAVAYGVNGDGEQVFEDWTLLNGQHGVNSSAIIDGTAACTEALSSPHSGGAQVVMVDATVVFLAANVDQQLLENLMDKADGNPARRP